MASDQEREAFELLVSAATQAAESVTQLHRQWGRTNDDVA